MILSDDSDGVRTLTLNRPEQLNAFSQQLCAALTAALRTAESDETVRAVVLTGAGRAFSAGTDLHELAANGDFRGSPDGSRWFDQMIDHLAGFTKPLLCAVNGIAVGVGVTLLGHADLVFIADTARLRCPFTSLSLAPEAAASVTLPLLMGRQSAAWLLMSSEWIEATEAVSFGLAWRVVPAGDLLDVTLSHARRIAAHPLISLIATKKLISAAFADAIARGRKQEDSAFDLLLKTPESRAAVAAFATRPRKREP